MGGERLAGLVHIGLVHSRLLQQWATASSASSEHEHRERDDDRENRLHTRLEFAVHGRCAPNAPVRLPVAASSHRSTPVAASWPVPRNCPCTSKRGSLPVAAK